MGISKRTTFKLNSTKILTITASQEESQRNNMWLQTKKQTNRKTPLRKPVFLKILILSIQKHTSEDRSQGLVQSKCLSHSPRGGLHQCGGPASRVLRFQASSILRHLHLKMWLPSGCDV